MSNRAVVFARVNESKQPPNLYVARVLSIMEHIRKNATDPRGANPGDVLRHFGNAKYKLKTKVFGTKLTYKFDEINILDYETSLI